MDFRPEWVFVADGAILESTLPLVDPVPPPHFITSSPWCRWVPQPWPPIQALSFSFMLHLCSHISPHFMLQKSSMDSHWIDDKGKWCIWCLCQSIIWNQLFSFPHNITFYNSATLDSTLLPEYLGPPCSGSPYSLTLKILSSLSVYWNLI